MDAHTITLPSKPPLPPVRLFLHGGLSCRPRGRAPACWRGVGRSASSHHHTIIISSSNLASEILVLLPLHTTPLGYGCLGVQQRRRRSNEICHGEIPTFLIEHTATPIHPLFLPLGANGSAGWQRASLRSACSSTAAAVCRVLLLLLLSLSLRLRLDLHWQVNMIDAHRFPFSLTRLKTPPAASSLSSRSESAFLSSGVELHGV